MSQRRNLTVGAAILTAVAVGWACERSATPAGPDLGRPSFHAPGECPLNKFTGGGRIDPIPPNSLNGKVTFGFNVHLDENCQVVKGELQVVHHPTKTRYHSHLNPSETTSRETDECAAAGFEGGLLVDGVVRVKHGNGEWHNHDFRARFCDNGEPGRGHDTFRFRTDDGTGPGHGDTGDVTGDTPLTGGNIQAH